MEIKKFSGELEEFSSGKLRKYLQKIGAATFADRVIENVTALIDQGQIHSSAEIRQHVAADIENIGGKRLAAIYLLKESLFDLGPTGYHFEQLVGRLFEAESFKVEVGTILHGRCVDHEVDVYATQDDKYNLVECKFHNDQGTRSDVTTALYTHARFNDIIAATKGKLKNPICWLATNTKLTGEALKYAECSNIKLLSLYKPKGRSILDLVIQHNIFPITSLNSIKSKHAQLLEEGYVSTSDIQQALDTDKLALTSAEKSLLKEELSDLTLTKIR